MFQWDRLTFGSVNCFQVTNRTIAKSRECKQTTHQVNLWNVIVDVVLHELSSFLFPPSWLMRALFWVCLLCPLPLDDFRGYNPTTSFIRQQDVPFSLFNAHLSLILGVVWRYFLMFSFFSPLSLWHPLRSRSSSRSSSRSWTGSWR